jgi:Lhr-like helicase
MLAEGFATRNGARAIYVHRDAVHHKLRERRGARLVALTSGGTIPESADYTVLLEPQAEKVGTVNEDFAVESLAGDIFQLGNMSYRILKVEPGRVRVEDAHGAPPNIPFWLGEAPGRSDELSFAVSRLREEVAALLDGAREEGRARTTAARPRWRCSSIGSAWTPTPRASSSTTSPMPTPRSARCRRSRASSWSASSTHRAACSSSSIRPSAAG